MMYLDRGHTAISGASELEPCVAPYPFVMWPSFTFIFLVGGPATPGPHSHMTTTPTS